MIIVKALILLLAIAGAVIVSMYLGG